MNNRFNLSCVSNNYTNIIKNLKKINQETGVKIWTWKLKQDEKLY